MIIAVILSFWITYQTYDSLEYTPGHKLLKTSVVIKPIICWYRFFVYLVGLLRDYFQIFFYEGSP